MSRSVGNTWGSWGPRQVLAGHFCALICGDAWDGGMQWLQTYKPSRLSPFVAIAFCGGRDQTRLQRRTVDRLSR